MKWGEAASVFAAYGAWRATGSARAGAVLSEALASDDETNRTAAGMLLARGGAKALPLLRANLERGRAVPMTLRLLGDIGGTHARELIEPYTRHTDASIVRAAHDALAAAATH